MPKVVFTDAKGVTQSRGGGVQHLSASAKGFGYQVKSGSLTALMTAGDTVVSGLVIPAGAVVTKVGLKILSPSVDGGTGAVLTNTITDINIGTTAFTLAAAIDLVAASENDILLYDLSPGATGTSASGAVDVATQVAGGKVTVTETASNLEVADDTGAVITVIVEYYQPIF